jgi:hypothetical protein
VHDPWDPPHKFPHPLLCYYLPWDIQQYDFELFPFGTTTVPHFILLRPLVLELKYADILADGWTDWRDQPIMRSPVQRTHNNNWNNKTIETTMDEVIIGELYQY